MPTTQTHNAAGGGTRTRNGAFERLFIDASLADSKGAGFRIIDIENDQVPKGVWWMPWHAQAMKDVIRCDKRRGAANKL